MLVLEFVWVCVRVRFGSLWMDSSEEKCADQKRPANRRHGIVMSMVMVMGMVIGMGMDFDFVAS